VLKIPVADIIETSDASLCWVKNGSRVKKRVIELGHTNDAVTIVTTGLNEGQAVVLNPAGFIEEAELESMRPDKEAANEQHDSELGGGKKKSIPGEVTGGKQGQAKRTKPKGAGAKAKPGESKPKASGQSIGTKLVTAGDKNGDGVLTIDEFQEKDRENFPKVDANGDGKVDAGELDAAIKAASGK